MSEAMKAGSDFSISDFAAADDRTIVLSLIAQEAERLNAMRDRLRRILTKVHGQSVVDIAFTPGELDADDCALIRSLVSQRVGQLDAECARLHELRARIDDSAATSSESGPSEKKPDEPSPNQQERSAAEDADNDEDESPNDGTSSTVSWLQVQALLPQGPEPGWEPYRLTEAAKKLRPDATGEKIRKLLDRWKNRGQVERVDGLWRRPAPLSSQQPEESKPM